MIERRERPSWGELIGTLKDDTKRDQVTGSLVNQWVYQVYITKKFKGY